MKMLILGTVLLFSQLTGTSQPCSQMEPRRNTVGEATTLPAFPGGKAALHRFVREHLNYPGLAREYGVEGSVVLRLSLTARGTVRKARIVKGLGAGCDEASLQLVRRMPDWRPACRTGRPIPSAVLIELRFRLQ